MEEQSNSLPRSPNGATLSRRQILVGAATVAIATGATRLLASPTPKRRRRPTTATTTPLRRYMASSVMLLDGRVLVTGGYDKPFADGSAPAPLSSTMIFDPRSGSWSVGAPMALRRARHAAVVLADGRVAVLGGIVSNPTASVEIYDPQTNQWSAAKQMAQPRYDHSAATDGSQIFVLGGSAGTMLSGVEVYLP